MNKYYAAALDGLLQAAQAPLPEMKPGMKTSEFWLSAAGAIGLPVAMSVGAVSPTAAGVSAGLMAVYTMARSYTKAAHSNAVSEVAGAQAYAGTKAQPTSPEVTPAP